MSYEIQSGPQVHCEEHPSFSPTEDAYLHSELLGMRAIDLRDRHKIERKYLSERDSLQIASVNLSAEQYLGLTLGNQDENEGLVLTCESYNLKHWGWVVDMGVGVVWQAVVDMTHKFDTVMGNGGYVCWGEWVETWKVQYRIPDAELRSESNRFVDPIAWMKARRQPQDVVRSSCDGGSVRWRGDYRAGDELTRQLDLETEINQQIRRSSRDLSIRVNRQLACWELDWETAVSYREAGVGWALQRDIRKAWGELAPHEDERYALARVANILLNSHDITKS